MNNREDLRQAIDNFVGSDEKGMLVMGTHQFNKHKSVMAWLNQFRPGSRVLFVINKMDHITDSEFIGLRKQPKIGEPVKFHNNTYEFSNFNLLSRTHLRHDYAIVYPIDALVRNKEVKVFEELARMQIGKIFYVTWMDMKTYDFSILDPYVQCRAYYDIEEEDPAAHQRVLNVCNASRN